MAAHRMTPPRLHNVYRIGTGQSTCAGHVGRADRAAAEGSSVWQETTGMAPRRPEWGEPPTRPQGGWNGAAPTDQQFITILMPCLALVAPVGMSLETQDAWLEAATLALADVPLNMLRRGAAVAMKAVDHHSKIVPAILGEVNRLREAERAVARVWQGADNAPAALPAPGGERPTENEVADICRRFAVGRFSAHDSGRDPDAPARAGAIRDEKRPSRAPAREDYIRMGVDPAVLDQAASDPAQAA